MITITTPTPGDGLRRVDGIAHGLRHSSSKFYTFVLRSTVSWLRGIVRTLGEEEALGAIRPPSNYVSGLPNMMNNIW